MDCVSVCASIGVQHIRCPRNARAVCVVIRVCEGARREVAHRESGECVSCNGSEVNVVTPIYTLCACCAGSARRFCCRSAAPASSVQMVVSLSRTAPAEPTASVPSVLEGCVCVCGRLWRSRERERALSAGRARAGRCMRAGSRSMCVPSVSLRVLHVVHVWASISCQATCTGPLVGDKQSCAMLAVHLPPVRGTVNPQPVGLPMAKRPVIDAHIGTTYST